MALSLDGSGATYGTSGTAPTVSLTCSLSGNIIVVVVTYNTAVANAGPSSVTASGATFSRDVRSTCTTNTNGLDVWSGYASGTFSGTITVNMSSSASFATIHAFGINGAASASYVDATNSGTTDPRSITTTTADTFIVGAFRQSSVANPTAGAGFTQIRGNTGGGYTLSEYKIVSTTQSGLSVPIGTGVSDSNASIAIAYKIASGGGGTFYNPMSGRGGAAAQPVWAG